jgi:formiminoglutamate deiminase
MEPVEVLHFRLARLADGWARNVRLSMQGGRVAGLEVEVEPAPGDTRHGIALPGLPDLHSHAFQRGMAGLAERRGPSDDSFWTWREIMYRFVDRIGPGELKAIAALAYVEMLETGFTRVGEFHYLHHAPDGRPYDNPGEMAAAIAAAAEETGIGLSLLPVFYAHSGFGGGAPGPGQRRFICDPDRFAGLLEASRAALSPLPDAVLGLAPHSLRAVTPEELAVLPQMVPQGPIHIHIAEQVREVEDCIAWSGARPVDWLLDHMPVGPRWCLVHATHMREAEAARLAQTGAVAGLCPITEANLGDGLFNAPAFLAANGRFGIGSDSNVLIDASEELRLLEYGQRLGHRGRNLFPQTEGASTGEALFDGAVAGGAQALGVTDGLRVGVAADLVSLDDRHPSLLGKGPETVLDSWIFAAGRTAIDGVWRRGRQVVADGRHIRRAAVEADYAAVLQRLL